MGPVVGALVCPLVGAAVGPFVGAFVIWTGAGTGPKLTEIFALTWMVLVLILATYSNAQSAVASVQVGGIICEKGLRPDYRRFLADATRR